MAKKWNKEHFENIFPIFMSRIFGEWFLDGETLAEYAINNRILLDDEIYCGVVGNHDKVTKAIKERAHSFCAGYKKLDDTHFKVKINNEKWINITYYDESNMEYICAPQSFSDERRKQCYDITINGVWDYKWFPDRKVTVRIPFKTGSWLDRVYPLWFKRHKYLERESQKQTRWIHGKRKDNALELMMLIHQRAKESDIGEHIFPGFGTMLGIVREHNFIANDHDMDHCLLMDKITPAQEALFFQNMNKEFELNGKKYPAGLFEGREKNVEREYNPRFIWASCGHKRIKSEKGVKSCVWGFFEYDDYLWHTKGRRWITQKRFKQKDYLHDVRDEAICKGVPKKFFNNWTTIDFHGVTVNIPVLAGHCVDSWYPGWVKPQKAKSSKEHVLVIPEWKIKKGWKVL